MVYYGKRKAYRQRGTPYKRARSNVRVSGYARPAMSRTRAVNVRLGAMELKNIDLQGGFQPGVGVTTGIVELLNGVAQGVTATTRIGRRICMRRVQISYTLNTGTTTVGSSSWRVIVVYDKQTNATALTAAQVMESDQIDSPYNLGNQRRFKILYDKTQSFGTQGPQTTVFKKSIKMKKYVEFNTNTAGNVGDITTGSLYLIVYQNGNFTTAGPNSVLYTRVLFADV